jgi:hypothetical protein
MLRPKPNISDLIKSPGARIFIGVYIPLMVNNQSMSPAEFVRSIYRKITADLCHVMPKDPKIFEQMKFQPGIC